MALRDFFLWTLGQKEKQAEKPSLFSEIFTSVYNRLAPARSNSEHYRGWVFSAVNAIAEQHAVLDLRLWRKSGGKKDQLFDHPALSLLQYVNEGMTYYDLMFFTGAHQEINGRCFWIILRNNGNLPAEIILPDPTKMKPRINKFGQVEAYLLFFDNGKAVEIEKDLVVPFKNFNPQNNFDGFSTIQAAKLAVETDEYAAMYNRNWFQNSGRPDVVLKLTSDMTKDQKEKLKEMWRTEYAGVKNTGKMLIAPKGMEVDTLSTNHSDMEYVEGRKMSREEILGIFRVPKTILGLTEEVNRASAEAAMYGFVLFTMMPKWTRAVNALNEYFLPMFPNSDGLIFDFTNKPPEDPQALVEQASQGVNSGLLTINEGRQMLGKPPVADGDTVFLPFGLSPYADILESDVEKAAKKTDNSFAKTADEMVNAFKILLAPPPVPKAEEKAKKDLTFAETSPDEFEEKGQKRTKKRDELLVTFEKKFKGISQKLFKDQKDRAIANVRNMDKAKAKEVGFKKAQDILDADAEIKITMDMFTPAFKELVGKAGQEALDAIDAEMDFDTDKAADFIKKNTKRFAKEVTLKTTRELRTLIAAGVEKGESITELTARIENYAGFSEGRSEMIARTETIRGSAAADKEAWKQSGVVAKIVWYTALDERVDDDCAILHGEEVAIDEDFRSEDQLLEMGIEPYGGALNAPPLHPNCRCILLPVLEE